MAAEVVCVVVAAGAGTRLGAGVPKAFVDIRGRTMLERAVDGVRAAGPIDVIVVVPADRVDEATALLPDVRVVAGDVDRQGSVARGLALVGDADVVLVHDAARCGTPAAVFDRVLAAVAAGADGAVPVLPVVDTIRTTDGQVLGGVVDRDTLRAMQTPQGFRASRLREAYAAADEPLTDDAALVQRIGGTVVSVVGDPAGFKVTTAADLARARDASGPEIRVGIGTDIHAVATDDARPLSLAGLQWPGERRLEGHSDGDAALHAVVDALLSAAGLGDIGGLVGVDQPGAEGADSTDFLRTAVATLADAGWTVGNVALQIVARRPHIGVRRREAEAVIEAIVGAPVSVSGTTSDGLGFTGRGDGVQAFATASIRRG